MPTSTFHSILGLISGLRVGAQAQLKIRELSETSSEFHCEDLFIHNFTVASGVTVKLLKTLQKNSKTFCTIKKPCSSTLIAFT